MLKREKIERFQVVQFASSNYSEQIDKTTQDYCAITSFERIGNLS